jgi:arylsulfatase A-like enzyme
LLFLSLPFFHCFAFTVQAAPADRPNVVIVMTDDQGYGDLGCHGHPFLRTPRMDRLRAESVRLTDFHVMPSCAPTRSSLLTGVNALHNGSHDPTGQNVLLDRRYLLMSDVFQRNGYRTALYGKWHLGANFLHYRPHERGFDDAVCFCRGGHGSHPNYWNSDSQDDFYYHNGTLKQYQGNATDLWFRLGRAFVQACRAREEPFFLYLPLNAPHIPWLVPASYRKPYLNRGLRKQQINFYAMLAHVDEQLGAFIDFLKQERLWDNTVFIFLSDNGTALHGQDYNAGLRGKKGSAYEGGHRVPCFISYPDGRLGKPRDIESLTHCLDLLPTLMDLCHLKAEGLQELEGVSLTALLQGQTQDLPERILVSQSTFLLPQKYEAAVMSGTWRLVHGKELYRLDDDPGQQRDLAARYPEQAARLRNHYDVFWQDVKVGGDPHPYYIGDEEVMLTAYDWMEEGQGQVYNWPHLRKGDMKNGRYLLMFEQSGTYRIGLRRWPREADVPLCDGVPEFSTFDPFGTPEDDRMGPYIEGKALAIRQARIRLGERDLRQSVQADDKEAVFEVSVPEGRTTFQTWFVDADGREFGAYYVYLKKR